MSSVQTRIDPRAPVRLSRSGRDAKLDEALRKGYPYARAGRRGPAAGGYEGAARLFHRIGIVALERAVHAALETYSNVHRGSGYYSQVSTHLFEKALIARALSGLAQVPGVKVLGIVDPASPSFARKGGVIPFGLKGFMAHTVARRLAARGGMGVRSGCHCAHLTVKRLEGVPPWAEQIQRLILTVFRRFELPGVVRVSLGIENSEADVDTLIHVLGGIARQPKDRASEKAVRPQMDDACKASAERVYGP